MKTVSAISAAILMLTVACSHPTKYDKKRMDVQRQEAIDMVKKSKNIEIKRGLGNDKIILKDE